MAKRTQSKSVRAARTPARPPASRPPPPDPSASAWGSWLLGFLVVAGVAGSVFGWSAACEHAPPPGAELARPAPPPSETPVFAAADAALSPRDAARGDALASSGAYAGPLIGAIAPQAPIYSVMEAYRDKRIGYLRLGGKAPVDPTPIRASNCDAGWYHLLGGGYLCGKFATLDLNHPQVRLGTTPPNLDDILPYKYAWNTTMGTPLYKSVPTREAMLEYEPYLKPKPKDDIEVEAVAVSDETPYAPLALGDAGAELRKPWWQQTDADGGKPDIRLSDLTEGSDRVVAKRMVKGFYVAIDKSFPWHNRTWYRTTASLVAPADRFALNKPPTFKGMDLTVGEPAAGAAFVLGRKAQRYQVDVDKRQALPTAPVDRFTGVRLTGRTATVATVLYRETSDGWWMRASDGPSVEPGPAPAGLLPGEKWIDVSLGRQTLVAMQGDVAVYATLVSTGRKAKDPTDKLHDHQTVQGSFRIREKHIAITMDGDGPAPGDMPYSIEDVPYVMYFEGSYALHGAFWHSNFGHEQSHGCVNLAPLDAKQLFFWSEPQLPQGWHGVIATKDRPGTRVLVHE